jgi:hypothetical protein
MSEDFGWLWKEAVMTYGISLEGTTKTMKKKLSQVADFWAGNVSRSK